MQSERAILYSVTKHAVVALSGSLVPDAPTAKLAHLEWAIGVNLWGVIHGVKVFTPLMLAQNTECYIVNTSSTAGPDRR